MKHTFDLSLDKIRLTNLAYSLQREWLCTGDNGCYASSTLTLCHTRKYHGLYVAPQPALGQDNYVLLAQMQETVRQHGKEFHLGVTRYGDIYEPKGHKYLERFALMPHPCWWYRVGGVLLRKEILMHKRLNRLFIAYTLEEAHSPTTLELRPFCSFRRQHEIRCKGAGACEQVGILPSGIKLRMYPEYGDLFIESTRGIGFQERPDWYNNITYWQEQQRGYEAVEDWFTPGCFARPIAVGETVYLTVGVESFGSIEEKDLAAAFKEGKEQALPAESMRHCLENAAADLIVHRQGRTQIMAGYPWFGPWGRDTFIALPGLCLATRRFEVAEEVIDGMLADRKGALFPNVGTGEEAAYNSADAPLWFVHAVQQFMMAASEVSTPEPKPKSKSTAQKKAMDKASTASTDEPRRLWNKYGSSVLEVVEAYATGHHGGIGMGDDGLIYAAQAGKALTWMDAVVHGQPITPRAGAPVEINALWYNALRFALESVAQYGAARGKAQAAKDFAKRWQSVADEFPERFKNAFWSKDHGYLADVYVNGQGDFSLRPNQIIAAALPYKVISNKVCQLVVEKVSQVLLTPRGLRTLAPMDSRFEGVYEGDQATRDARYHQGIVWPWLLEPFACACQEVYGEQAKTILQKIWKHFEPALGELCMGTVAEIYDGNPPHAPRGAVSQAWSVSALLRINQMLQP